MDNQWRLNSLAMKGYRMVAEAPELARLDTIVELLMKHCLLKHLYVIGWHHVPINLDGRGRNLIQSNLRMWSSQEPLVENLVELTKDIGLVTHSTWIQEKRGNAIDPRCRSSLRFIVPYLAGSLGDFERYLEHHSRAQPWWPGHTLRYI